MIRKFMVVDDDPDDVDLFLEALSKIDKTLICDSSKNGRDLLNKLESGTISNPEIIFLDVNMPDINGWDCLANLKADSRFSSIPVIMYSTSSAKRDTEKALKLGALGFYEKPSSFSLLIDFLQMIVSIRNLDKNTIELMLQERGTAQKFHV